MANRNCYVWHRRAWSWHDTIFFLDFNLYSSEPQLAFQRDFEILLTTSFKQLDEIQKQILTTSFNNSKCAAARSERPEVRFCKTLQV
jgi:hypothetical protein